MLNRALYFLNENSLKGNILSLYSLVFEQRKYFVLVQNKLAVETSISFFVFNEDRLNHSRPFLRRIDALNVYQSIFYQHLNFMHKDNSQETRRIFNDLIKNRYINIQEIFQNLIFA